MEALGTSRHRLIRQDCHGMALTLVLVIIAAMAVLAVGLALDQAVEMRITANRRAAETAFRNAESGLAVAQEKLARWFATDPVNLQRQRTGSSSLPDWDFLFLHAVPYSGPNSRSNRYDEVKLNLGWDHRFKVFARTPEDAKDGAFTNLTGDNVRLVLRSVGFGPAQTQQETEVMVEAAAEPSQAAAYAQEGMAAIPSYVNMKDRHGVRAAGQPLAVVP
ncbi:hypothetical protein [Desulfosoma sp.]